MHAPPTYDGGRLPALGTGRPRHSTAAVAVGPTSGPEPKEFGRLPCAYDGGRLNPSPAMVAATCPRLARNSLQGSVSDTPTFGVQPLQRPRRPPKSPGFSPSTSFQRPLLWAWPPAHPEIEPKGKTCKNL